MDNFSILSKFNIWDNIPDELKVGYIYKEDIWINGNKINTDVCIIRSYINEDNKLCVLCKAIDNRYNIYYNKENSVKIARAFLYDLSQFNIKHAI